jgi:far upstream element-binding protein
MGVPMALPQNVSLDTTTPLTLDKRPKVGVPTTRVPMQTANPTTSAAAAVAGTASSTAIIITEKENIPVQYVGRIIGKGGEQIRDLQARSACKVDVDQNVPHGAPRVITYQGTRDKIDFAKSLVAMLCKDNWKTVELPLGFASRAQLQVPSGVIGKIIGRGGEMIKVSV